MFRNLLHYILQLPLKYFLLSVRLKYIDGYYLLGMDDLAHQTEDIVSKYKRLLGMARASLETNQKSLAEKDAQIAALKANVEKMEREKSYMVQVDRKQEEGNNSHPLIPRAFARRVDVNGVIWLLAQYDSHVDSWLSFSSELELDQYLQRIPGGASSIVKPARCLTPAESQQLQAEAKLKIDRVVEEFRRYRVKAEISRKQGIEEQASRSNSIAVSKLDDLRGESESAKTIASEASKYKEEIQRLQTQLAAVEAKWKLAYERVSRENESLRHSGAEAMLAAQWRERYESCVKEKYDLSEKLKVFEKGAGAVGVNGKSLEEAYNELRDEHRVRKACDLYVHVQASLTLPIYIKELQRRMNSVDRRREEHAGSKVFSEEVVLSSSSVMDSSKFEYIKNMVFQYLICKDEEIRVNLEIAIESVFRFTEPQRRSIEERRRGVPGSYFVLPSFLSSTSSA